MDSGLLVGWMGIYLQALMKPLRALYILLDWEFDTIMGRIRRRSAWHRHQHGFCGMLSKLGFSGPSSVLYRSTS